MKQQKAKPAMQAFEDWIAPHAIAYAVWHALSMWEIPQSLENAQEVWLDVLEHNLEHSLGLSIDSIQERLRR